MRLCSQVACGPAPLPKIFVCLFVLVFLLNRQNPTRLRLPPTSRLRHQNCYRRLLIAKACSRDWVGGCLPSPVCVVPAIFGPEHTPGWDPDVLLLVRSNELCSLISVPSSFARQSRHFGWSQLLQGLASKIRKPLLSGSAA